MKIELDDESTLPEDKRKVKFEHEDGTWYEGIFLEEIQHFLEGFDEEEGTVFDAADILQWEYLD